MSSNQGRTLVQRERGDRYHNNHCCQRADDGQGAPFAMSALAPCHRDPRIEQVSTRATIHRQAAFQVVLW